MSPEEKRTGATLEWSVEIAQARRGRPTSALFAASGERAAHVAEWSGAEGLTDGRLGLFVAQRWDARSGC